MNRAAWFVLLVAAQLYGSPPTIDGVLDDDFWKELPVQQFSPEGGGDLRVAVAGRYLYIGARLDEPSGRITARSLGRNPAWEEEDQLRITAGASIGYTDRLLQVNPLGAYSLERAVPAVRWVASVFPYSDERDAAVVYENIDKFLVATQVAEDHWTVEIAFPLSELSAPGPDKTYVAVERLRAHRPGEPGKSWRWPEKGPAAKIPVSSAVKWEAEPGSLQAPLRGNRESPITVGYVPNLPLRTAEWESPPWDDVTPLELLRDELPALLPRHRSQVKLLHDGRTLAVMARCVEPDVIRAEVRQDDDRAGRDDSFQVYLATSGSMYVQVISNAVGSVQEAAGFSGGSRISRRRDWKSGARAHVEQREGTWTVRMDIPLANVASALGEPDVPSEWRVLLARYRQARPGAAAEQSVLPIVRSATAISPARYRRLQLSQSAPAETVKTQQVEAVKAPDFGTVLTTAQRTELGLPGMVKQSQRERARAILESDRQAWKRVNSREEWEEFLTPRIDALKRWLGDFPSRDPLETRVTKEFHGRDYRRLDLVYRSRPGLWVTANLYLPDNPPERMPGIVIVHSHHRPRTQAELQDMGILWARAGSAVLIMDQIGHGERIETYPWNREAYRSRYSTGMQLYIAGESLMKWMAWDIIRGVDLLLERDDIDRDEIILLGAVAGGGDPAAVVAAIDPRIAAVAPFTFGESSPAKGPGNTGWPEGLADPGWGSWETTRNLPRSIVDRFLPWTILASVAPRRLIYSFEMGWDVETVPAWARYQKVFGFYGALDNLDEAHGFGTFPGPGECANIGPSQRKTLYPELEKWFGIPPPPSEPDDRRPEQELAALTADVADTLGMRPVHELAYESAAKKVAAARSHMATLDPMARRAWLQKNWAAKLGDIEPNRQANATSYWRRESNGADIEGLTLEVEPGVIVPILLMRPVGAEDARLPLVVVVSQGGKEAFLAHHRDEIDQLLLANVAVCALDVRGVGETAPDSRRIPLSLGIQDAATELMLGRTMLGARLKDLRSVLTYLARRPDIEPRRIAVWGNSDAPINPQRLLLEETAGWRVGPEIQHQAEPMGGLLAILAGLYEDKIKAIVVRRGLTSYLSILEDNFPYIPSDIIVPDSAAVGDLSDVTAALAPRPVLLTEMVDGTNRRESAATSEVVLAKWLVEHLKVE